MALTTTLEKKQNQILSKSIEAQNTVEAALEALSNNKLNKTGKAASSSQADKLANTTAIGSATKPVYFTDKGVPAACTYSLNKDVPSNAVFTDTHYTTKLYITGSTGTTNAQTSNGATYLRLFDDNTNRASIKITGTGATKVSSDSNGVITINSIDTNTAHTHKAGAGLTGSGVAGTTGEEYTYKVNLVDETVASNAATYTAGGSSKFYAVQLDKNNKLGVYVPWTDSNTTYSAGTGLSLNGTTFSLKTASKDTLGGVKTTSTVTSTNNHLACPIIDGVPYYKEYGSEVTALTTRMDYLFGNNPSILPVIDTNLVLSDSLSITDASILSKIYDSLTYSDGTPRRTAMMSFKDTGTGKVTLNFTVSIYKESDTRYHYLLVSYFKDSNGIYKVYLGFRKDSGNFGHDAIKVETYGTF